MLVRSEKTAHHVGQGSRVPIFTDLMPFIEDAQELSEGKGEYLIHRYRDEESNLRTQLHRIIKRAHLTPWPKAFQNLRASRATHLVMHHPLHVVSQWTGHSIETMRKFYLQVTDEHREAALKIKPQLPPAAIENLSAQPMGEAEQNPKQSMRDTPRNTAQEKSQTPFITAFGSECLGLSGPLIAAEGLEQLRLTNGKCKRMEPCEAKPEALLEASSGDLETLARALANQLGQYETLELIKHLVSRVQ